jgi:hypothetical protein
MLNEHQFLEKLMQLRRAGLSLKKQNSKQKAEAIYKLLVLQESPGVHKMDCLPKYE